jgi:hypothetical protein
VVQPKREVPICLALSFRPSKICHRAAPEKWWAVPGTKQR